MATHEQKIFSTGTLLTDDGTQFALLQEIAAAFEFQEKRLYGPCFVNRFPEDIAFYGGQASLKCKNASINADAITKLTGSAQSAMRQSADFAGSLPPTAPVVTYANATEAPLWYDGAANDLTTGYLSGSSNAVPVQFAYWYFPAGKSFDHVNWNASEAALGVTPCTVSHWQFFTSPDGVTWTARANGNASPTGTVFSATGLGAFNDKYLCLAMTGDNANFPVWIGDVRAYDASGNLILTITDTMAKLTILPKFQAIFTTQDNAGNQIVYTFLNVYAKGMVIPLKLEDFAMPDFELHALPDPATGNVATVAFH